MCFSFGTSVGSFIAGILLNSGIAAYIATAGYSELPWRLAILGLWSFALLMQVAESVQWWHHDRGVPAPQSAETAAYWLNTLQPLAALVLIGGTYFAVNKTWPSPTLIVAAIAVAFFTYKAVSMSGTLLGRAGGISPAPGCDHNNLHWWNDEGLKSYLPLYLVAIFAAIMVLPTTSLQGMQTAWFFGSLMLSSALYKCGVGSVWCAYVAGAGLTVLVP